VVQDVVPFNHEFFIRLARAFPLLKNFCLMSLDPESFCGLNILSSDNNQSYAIAEYPHLTSLEMLCADSDHLEQFLNQRKTYAPCLTELLVHYHHLRIVTENFTKEETRRNCANVKRLYMLTPLAYSKDFYLYFPLLSM
jgi:hypothetical protein